MLANSRQLHANWADVSFDVPDKIKENLVSEENDASGQEFVKAARPVNKHWSIWASNAARCITIPTSNRLRSFAKVCSGSIQRSPGTRGSQAKWMRSGGDVARHERQTFFASLGSIDMLKTVASKFVGVEKLTMSHHLPNPQLAVPFLRELGRLRHIVLKSGNARNVNLSWLMSIEGLRCLSLHPISKPPSTLYPYQTIGTLSGLESLHLKVNSCCYVGSLSWLGGMQYLRRLQLGAGRSNPEYELRQNIPHLKSLTDLSFCRFTLTKAMLVQFRELELLHSLTLVLCQFEPRDAVACLNSLLSLSTFAITGHLIALDYEILGTLTSLHTLSVVHLGVESNSAYGSWMAALTCLTHLEVHLNSAMPDFTHWAGLPGLRHLGLKTEAPLPAEQLGILKSQFPVAQVVVCQW